MMEQAVLRKPRRHAAPHARPAGYSLIELVVVLAMMSIFALVFYGVFTFNVEASRVQSQIADMHQNLRVAQHDLKRLSRMSGRGGLPASVAIGTQNNVPLGTRVGGPGSPQVLEGTDVLTVRGVFTNPVYQVKATAGALASGRLEVLALTPSGESQDLGPIAEAVQRALAAPAAAREPLVVVSPLGQYSIFALQTGSVQMSGDINPVPLKVEVELADDPGYRGTLVEGGNNPPEMTTVASLGIIEEYRYYIRRVQPVPGRVVPRLSRARFYAGTDIVHPSDPTAAEDIADHIVDLQVALGFDRFDGAGAPVPDGVLYEGERDDDADRDEWLFNHEDDVPAVAGAGSLELVRLSLLARTSRGDRRWSERQLAWLEDHDYLNGPVSPAATDRLRRRRLAQTVVNLRNL